MSIIIYTEKKKNIERAKREIKRLKTIEKNKKFERAFAKYSDRQAFSYWVGSCF